MAAQTLPSVRPDIESLRRIPGRADNVECGTRRPEGERRTARRFAWPAPAVVFAVDHPGGGGASYAVVPRNISADGLAVLHTGYVHIGARCRVSIPTSGASSLVAGVIVGCRLMEGTTHEIRVRFDVPLELDSIDGLIEARPIRVAAGFDPAQLRGQVLLLDDVDVEARLLAFHLAPTSIALVTVATISQARAALARHRFDLVLSEIAIDGESGLDVLTQLRDAGASSPIVVVTADTRESRLVEIEWAGADAILPKPYDPEQLYGLLARWLPRGRAPEAAVCSWRLTDANQALVEHYVLYARGIAGRLEAMLDAGDLAGCRSICLTIKGAAPGYGFPHLGALAETAVDTVDRTQCIVRSSASLREVSRLCRQLQIGPAAGVNLAA